LTQPDVPVGTVPKYKASSVAVTDSTILASLNINKHRNETACNPDVTIFIIITIIIIVNSSNTHQSIQKIYQVAAELSIFYNRRQKEAASQFTLSQIIF